MRFFIVSFGCQMNSSDSERVVSVLESLGIVQTDIEEDADILGLVACSVRQRAIDRALSRINKWNKWKRSRALLTFATGCVLPADRDQFAEHFDILFQIDELPDLPDMIRQFGVVTAASATNAFPELAVSSRVDDDIDENRKFWSIVPTYNSSFEAYVPIQNGCDKFCSFCAVPYTRGREVSRASGEILEEVERLVDSGFRSITLLGQNVNSYGLDKRTEEIRFHELLDRIGTIGKRSRKRFWVYFTSPHPRDMSRDVLEVIAAYPHLAKQIHLPLQSGDDKVLLRMNRNYGIDRYCAVVDEIREHLPGATLFTDIIVGFPGETAEQHERTKSAMLEFRYNMAYIAMYSPRPGTRSSRLPDDVPHEEKKRRLQDLSLVLKEISLEHNRSLLDSAQTVLVSGRDRDPRYLSGRTEGKVIVRFAADDGDLIGTFQDVHISKAAAMSVEGELVPISAGVGR